jgi:hypothetical protein
MWSGIQKMNFNFAHEVIPFLFSPLEIYLPAIKDYYSHLGIAASLIEFMIGLGLLIRRSRKVAVYAAVLMHLSILTVLVLKDYNSIVWVWNLTLIFAVIFAFWRMDNSIKEVLAGEKYSVRTLVVCAAILLPVLNFFGWWDSFLSGAYYSGNVKIPAIRINDEVFQKLPPTARSVVFLTGSTGERILPPLEWSIADTNAPVYLEERVFRQVTLEICRLATDKSQVELVIRNRPSILDGSYSVTTVNCADLIGRSNSQTERSGLS